MKLDNNYKKKEQFKKSKKTKIHFSNCAEKLKWLHDLHLNRILTNLTYFQTNVHRT